MNQRRFEDHQIFSLIKKSIAHALGPKLLGMLDYYRFPLARQSWGGPLNGQQQRQRMVSELIEQLDISAIVETGTFRGTTTEFFADLCPGPVFTIEADKRLYGYSRARLFGLRNVVSILADSRSGLRTLIDEKRLEGRRILFYLDAHGASDLPLIEEIDLVFRNFNEAVVLIDDFKVPHDAGYGFDDFGNGAILALDYILETIMKYKLKIFFPTVPSASETGQRRGCILLVANPIIRNLVQTKLRFFLEERK